mmetsp:Transcript_56680/g.64963  ORF Transcript_56680/g.64963 Transcript_56680/m.64963 type:complete len:143 (+) Transcript_56680:23-451(+)|eukprot:CAMPEP_0176440182 /NCGR_PEP_ID=MMETSP0127-20121128/20412_1 /TAXON_ID=938130 /ORGANISM="Platyophrya macrostoma, Strain WH" /LENGTH=142 /DNA_ID=CAMNT_0017824645 /DNA_START=5 /DNA_END=433 /DNA_ORIENTATION=+
MISANQKVQTISELDPTQKKWKVLYPAYIDSTKKIDQGRAIPLKHCVENPTIQEMSEILQYLKIRHVIEPHKAYPKDWINPGRIRVQLLDDDSSKPLNEEVPNKKKLMMKMGELIPKLKSRVNAASSTTTSAKAGKSKKKNR